jgi:hypothetical protein
MRVAKLTATEDSSLLCALSAGCVKACSWISSTQISLACRAIPLCGRCVDACASIIVCLQLLTVLDLPPCYVPWHYVSY